MRIGKRKYIGFTLLELMLVLAVLGLIAGLAAPLVAQHLVNAKEAALKENLHLMRRALDDYYSDQGQYPDELTELTTRRYLRNIPADPITGSRETWLLEFDQDSETTGGIIDIHSGSEDAARDGTLYHDW